MRLLTGAITEQVRVEARLRGLGARGTAAQIIPMEDLAGSRCRRRRAPRAPGGAGRGSGGRGGHSARVMRFPLRTKSAGRRSRGWG